MKNDLQKSISETTKLFGISEKEAAMLFFISKQALATMAKNAKGEALFHVAAKHCAGDLSGKQFRQLTDSIK